jgi:hypothetical protein
VKTQSIPNAQTVVIILCAQEISILCEHMYVSMRGKIFTWFYTSEIWLNQIISEILIPDKEMDFEAYKTQS